jgi:hypothetical protein
MPEEPDHYEVLQVSPNAEPGVILAAYRRLAQTYHPDVNPDPRAPERMRRFNRALEILSDPAKRAEYDRRRLRQLAVEFMREQQRVPYGTLYGEHPQGWRARAARLSFGWLAIAVGVGVVLAALVMILLRNTSESGTGSAVGGSRTASQSPRAAAAVASAAPSPTNTQPPVASATFSNGKWLVGEEIAPGMWRAVRSRECSWKRLASIEGASDVVAGTGSSLTVEIRPTDAAFWSDGCGWWTQIMEPPSASPGAPFGAGTWLVNQEIASGLWQNSDSSEGCRWARLASLDGAPGAITATGGGTSIVTIEINASDRAFDSSGCGTWSRVGD